MLRLPLKLSVLVFCLFVGSPQAQACRSHSWAHTIFFNTAEGMVELPPDAELIAEVLLTGSDQDGEATAANIVRVIKTSDAGVHQGEEIPIRVNTTSCGPEPISGRQGIIAAKVRTDIDDQPVLCLYSRPYGDVRIGSPDSHFLTECWPSVTALAKRTRLAAENGEVMAQIALGLMYEKGRYARQDKAKALKWLHLAAESGEAEAQYELGAKYRRDRNDKEAVEWFKLAAAQGHAQAGTEIGPTHEHGGSFKQSDAAAGSAGAVEQGNREAKLALEMEALKRAAEK